MELLGLYLRLFLSFFKIGLFGFGGGYAMLPLIRYEVVNAHNWLSLSDFTDIVAISQTTPGPVSFNMATFVGYKAVCESGYSVLGAVLGAAVCTFAVSLPALILMGILTRLYMRFSGNYWVGSAMKGMRPTVIGLIGAAALMLMDRHNFTDYKSPLIFIAVFAASLLKVHPVVLILCSGIAGYFLY